MKYHKEWERRGEGIYQCQRCGLYRCHALRDFTTDASDRRLVDVEYSTVRGDVIALNPTQQPPCEAGAYV